MVCPTITRWKNKRRYGITRLPSHWCLYTEAYYPNYPNILTFLTPEDKLIWCRVVQKDIPTLLPPLISIIVDYLLQTKGNF